MKGGHIDRVLRYSHESSIPVAKTGTITAGAPWLIAKIAELV